MGVGPNHRRDFTVKEAAHCDFLARRFTVNIDNNVRSFCAHLRDRFFYRSKWILQNRLHECAALHVDHTDLSLRRFEHDRSASGRARRIIQRSEQSRFGVDKRKNIFLVPGVIASSHNRNAGPQKIDRDFAGDAATARGVLAVHDNKINLMLFL